ncbi:MAG: BLUF domain-containing protein [Gammaproteobacteria bacterium]|nr:BLUF domain-containing protein [Gammaproteobacteria bacterium]MCP5200872.1 BLUF domain-containing protein [Gammaproteobacteria bacterium]
MPVRLIYCSRALREMSLQDIQNILRTARANNERLGICGMLSYQSSWFLQVLEGPRSEVNELFLDIADDPRHDAVTIIAYEYVDEALFSDWRMGYAADGGAVAQLLHEFGLERFEPLAMSPLQALRFLRELSSAQDLAA